MNKPASKYDRYSLRDIVTSLVGQCPGITRAFLFGSRRHRTRSVRSDVDVLLEVGHATRSEDVRDFALATCRALDFFLVEGGTARSCANGSKVSASSKRELIRRLDAIEFWNFKSGFLPVDIDWDFETLRGVDMPMTTLLSAQPFPSKADAVSNLVSGEAPVPHRRPFRDHPLAIAVGSAAAATVIVVALFESLRVAPLKERLDALSAAAPSVTSESGQRPAAPGPITTVTSDSAARGDTLTARR